MCSTIGGEVCKEKCRNEVDGISCYCRTGFQLKDDLVSCEGTVQQNILGAFSCKILERKCVT